MYFNLIVFKCMGVLQWYNLLFSSVCYSPHTELAFNKCIQARNENNEWLILVRYIPLTGVLWNTKMQVRRPVGRHFYSVDFFFNIFMYLEMQHVHNVLCNEQHGVEKSEISDLF